MKSNSMYIRKLIKCIFNGVFSRLHDISVPISQVLFQESNKYSLSAASMHNETSPRQVPKFKFSDTEVNIMLKGLYSLTGNKFPLHILPDLP